MDKKNKPPKWLLHTGIGIYLLIFLLDITYGEPMGSVELGTYILIGGFIGILCAIKNYERAREIGKKGNLAFFIGVFFGLIGLLTYYFYFKYHKAKSKIRKILFKTLFISSIILIIFLCIGFFLEGYVEPPSDYVEVPLDIENSCNDFCWQYEEATSYYVEYEKDYFICYCIDDGDEIINKINFFEKIGSSI